MNGPHFICIGAQKAGTGWLYEQLRAHPDFWMPPIKELHYFDGKLRTPRPSAGDRFDEAAKEARDPRDRQFLDRAREIFADPEMSPARYAELFGSRGSLISGDITPGYSALPPETAQAVAEAFAGAKVLFLARDPVERAWSQVSMWVRHGRIPRFDHADPEEVLRVLSHPGIKARSFPSEIVRRWRRFVAPENFGLYFFDDLKSDPGELRAEIVRWLGGDPAKASRNLPPDHNTKAKLEKLELNDEVKSGLALLFREELNACAVELGGPATRWASRYGFS